LEAEIRAATVREALELRAANEHAANLAALPEDIRARLEERFGELRPMFTQTLRAQIDEHGADVMRAELGLAERVDEEPIPVEYLPRISGISGVTKKAALTGG
jgi:hypothetical protein